MLEASGAGGKTVHEMQRGSNHDKLLLVYHPLANMWLFDNIWFYSFICQLSSYTVVHSFSEKGSSHQPAMAAIGHASSSQQLTDIQFMYCVRTAVRGTMFCPIVLSCAGSCW